MPYCVIQAGWVKNVSISSYAKGGRELGFYRLMVYEKFLTSENIMIRFLTFIQIELRHSLYIPGGGWRGGDFLVSSIWVCATDQVDVSLPKLQNMPRIFNFFQVTGPDF